MKHIKWLPIPVEISCVGAAGKRSPFRLGAVVIEKAGRHNCIILREINVPANLGRLCRGGEDETARRRVKTSYVLKPIHADRRAEIRGVLCGHREKDKEQESYGSVAEKPRHLPVFKKNRLLVVLDYPYVPLHNNGTESIMRLPVRKRDISNGTRSENGRVVWENMLSLKDTCRKLYISFRKFFRLREMSNFYLFSLGGSQQTAVY